MPQTIEVALNDRGQIVIAEPLQTRLGLMPGMALIVEQEDAHSVRLRPQLIDEGGILVALGEPAGSLLDVVREERERYLAEIAQRGNP